jgi:hypothetical protein
MNDQSQMNDTFLLLKRVSCIKHMNFHFIVSRFELLQMGVKTCYNNVHHFKERGFASWVG